MILICFWVKDSYVSNFLAIGTILLISKSLDVQLNSKHTRSLKIIAALSKERHKSFSTLVEYLMSGIYSVTNRLLNEVSCIFHS